MSKNFPREVIAELLRIGTRDFILCAGSRNGALLAEILSNCEVTTYNFFEERSAAFFALGLARQCGRPVAVVTTSGTAVAELLPATVEAHYSGVPLVLITADRPREYRGTGAPQAIEQVGIFSDYVEACVDWEGEVENLDFWSQRRPLQLNVCLEEIRTAAEPWGRATEAATADQDGVPKITATRSSPASPTATRAFERLKTFLGQVRRPLVIVGGIERSQRAVVEVFLKRSGLAVYAEATSGLRESSALSAQILKSGERFLSTQDFDGVLRIGSVPQLRFWRDLEGKKIPVLSLDEKSFSGLARDSECFAIEFPDLERWKLEGSGNFADVLRADGAYYQQKLELLSRYPESEPGLFHRLSRHIPEQSLVFLGNSLPVREWDLAAHYKSKALEIFASRGANGIDGQLSTFLGLTESSPGLTQAWGIFGDLTTLYDLSAPWVLPQLSENVQRNIVVINNGGGRIFSRVASVRKNFSEETRRKVIENEHDIKFESWARMWNLGYERWSHIPHLGVAASPSVIEICPQLEQSEDFWRDYRELFSV